VHLAPAETGRVGVWLVVGPFHSATFSDPKKPASPEALNEAPAGVDESHIVPRSGRMIDGTVPPPPPAGPPSHPSSPPVSVWSLGATNEGAIDLQSLLHASEHDVIAYAAGTLHVGRAGRYYLLVGADDGVRVSVDGRAVFLRDEARPEREDDDMIPLDLTAGDHELLFKLHQRDGGWRFGVRIVDETLRAPADSWLTLPGTSPTDARDLAMKASWVSLDRGLAEDGYHPALTVKFLEGAPRGIPLRVHAALVRAGREDDRILDLDAGEVPLDGPAGGEIVVALPPLVGEDAAKLEDGDYVYEIDVAGRALKLPFAPRRATRDAIAHADRALAPLAPMDPTAEPPPSPPPWLREGTLDSVANLRDRLLHLVDHGDLDADSQKLEARELDAAATALERASDPYARRTGPMRRAYRSPVDDSLQEFGLYVPPAYDPAAKKRWPLIVVLHGMNGRPLAMLRWFFGGDAKGRDQDWEDRHWTLPVDPSKKVVRPPPDPSVAPPSTPPLADPSDPLPPLDAFVVTPSGHGNAMYRDLGEDDVLRVLEWARRVYPIDPDRITITGPSMGGIGTGAIAFRHPDLFAAAAPLCGYHSYFIRRDVLWHPIRPWERLLAEERSNVEWAVNGENLPLWIVHGTLDLPEANSGVLIDRYEKLGYSVKHDHPNLGHNVWQSTYEGMKGAIWLLSHARVAHPHHVRFRTVRLRDGDDAWVHVRELSASDGWGEVEGTVQSRATIALTTKGVAALEIDRDPALVDPTGPLVVTIDGARVPFDPSEPALLHRDGKTWVKGAAEHDGVYKHGAITGPLRDAFHAPLLFVYGASDPAQARANEEVARAWAQIRWGTTVSYPILSDAEFFARGEALANDRALFLVGNAKSNRVVRALEPDLPITIDGDAVVVGEKRIAGSQVGAAFIQPNPRRADRYVVIVEGVDALGTWRSLSLPDLIPDFVVWDEGVAPSRGQVLLGPGSARAAGFFETDWSLPAHVEDPLASRPRPGAKTEYDATPYLP
jgi:predicted esterase